LGQFFYASIKFLGRKIANANGLYEGRLEIFKGKSLITVNPPKQVATPLIWWKYART